MCRNVAIRVQAGDRDSRKRRRKETGRSPHQTDVHSLQNESQEDGRVIILLFLKGHRSEVKALAPAGQVEGGLTGSMPHK